MQISQVLSAKIALFGDFTLLNPRGLSLRSLHGGLLERYKFLNYSTELDLSKGVRYGEGEFVYEDKPIGVSVTIFNTGLLVETLVSTEAAEGFFNDVAEWLTTIGFRSPKELITNTVYESQLVVQAELDIAKSFDKLQAFAKVIGELSGNLKEQMSGFYVGADGAQLSTFTFERRAAVPFSQNQYFSRAALPTSKHIRALKAIEKILS